MASTARLLRRSLLASTRRLLVGVAAGITRLLFNGVDQYFTHSAWSPSGANFDIGLTYTPSAGDIGVAKTLIAGLLTKNASNQLVLTYTDVGAVVNTLTLTTLTLAADTEYNIAISGDGSGVQLSINNVIVVDAGDYLSGNGADVRGELNIPVTASQPLELVLIPNASGVAQDLLAGDVSGSLLGINTSNQIVFNGLSSVTANNSAITSGSFIVESDKAYTINALFSANENITSIHSSVVPDNFSSSSIIGINIDGGSYVYSFVDVVDLGYGEGLVQQSGSSARHGAELFSATIPSTKSTVFNLVLQTITSFTVGRLYVVSITISDNTSASVNGVRLFGDAKNVIPAGYNGEVSVFYVANSTSSQLSIIGSGNPLTITEVSVRETSDLVVRNYDPLTDLLAVPSDIPAQVSDTDVIDPSTLSVDTWFADSGGTGGHANGVPSDLSLTDQTRLQGGEFLQTDGLTIRADVSQIAITGEFTLRASLRVSLNDFVFAGDGNNTWLAFLSGGQVSLRVNGSINNTPSILNSGQDILLSIIRDDSNSVQFSVNGVPVHTATVAGSLIVDKLLCTATNSQPYGDLVGQLFFRDDSSGDTYEYFTADSVTDNGDGTAIAANTGNTGPAFNATVQNFTTGDLVTLPGKTHAWPLNQDQASQSDTVGSNTGTIQNFDPSMIQ